MPSFDLLIVLTTLLFAVGYEAAYYNDHRQHYQIRTIDDYNTASIINSQHNNRRRYLQVSTPPADCLNLLADSADINKQLKAEDYYTFTDAYANGYYSANNINSYNELPVENRKAFVELACPCSSSSPSLSMVPSVSPTIQSSFQPSQSPTIAISSSPSELPSIEPSISIQPTLVSSSSPSGSMAPSNKPSPLPSIASSTSPSHMPSFVPTTSKSLAPSTSLKPSIEDCCEGNIAFLDVSGINTSNPDSMSDELKEYLSNICSVTLDVIGDKGIKTPSLSPSITMNPSIMPSVRPSTQPSIIPSGQPSAAPTSKPTTRQPTRQPSRRPSRRPVTRRPTRAPKTPRPTRRPSSSITTIITPFPSLVPTLLPTISEPEPTETPTELPTLPAISIINPPSPSAGIINDDPTMIPTPLIELAVITGSPIIESIKTTTIEPTLLVSEDTLSSSSLEPTLLASQDTLSSTASPVKVSTDDPFSVSVTSSVYVSPTISPSKDGLASNYVTNNGTTSTDNEATGSLPWSDWCEKDDGSLYPCPGEEVEAGLLPWSNDTSTNSNDTSVSLPVNNESLDSSSNTTFGGALDVIPTPSPQEESSSSASLETVDETNSTEGPRGLSSGAIFGIILAVVTIPLGVVYLSHRRG